MNQLVIITGGTKGIGFAAAKKFLSCGDKVILLLPEEIANAIWLMSLPEASAINGTAVMADDGYSSFKDVDGFQAESKTPLQATGYQICSAASSGVFDPRGSRQISMQAWLLGSLLAGINFLSIQPFFLLLMALCQEFKDHYSGFSSFMQG